MNIFILDKNTKKSAQAHCNTHVIKMGLEIAQILATVLSKHNIKTQYKPTHPNHPSTVWAGINQANFKYARKLGLEICKEYTYRYGKKHSCEDFLRGLDGSILPKGKLTEFAQAMPDQYRNKDAVQAYRDYYNGDKLPQGGWRFSYKNRRSPSWAKEIK